MMSSLHKFTILIKIKKILLANGFIESQDIIISKSCQIALESQTVSDSSQDLQIGSVERDVTGALSSKRGAEMEETIF